MLRRTIALITVAAVACAATALSAWGVESVPVKAKPKIIAGDGVTGPKGMMWGPGGEFLLGSDHKLAQASERPAHRVKVAGFWMDRHHATNAEFRRVVAEHRYFNTAERNPGRLTIQF